MREIELTQGHVALVDDEDFDAVNQYQWHALASGSTYYARRNHVNEDGTRAMLILHRVLMNAPDDMEVDHEDGNGLNCQRYNMRLATHSQNKMNAPYRFNTSGYRGVVSLSPGRWTVRLMKNYRNIGGGTYDTPEEAARVYDQLAREHHGEFATLNFPEDYPS